MGGQDYEAPDYAAANESAVQASARNVAPLSKIQAAKTLGTKAILSESDLRAMGLNPSDYNATDGGYEYTDFTGVGDDVTQGASTQAYLNAIKTTTPELLKLQEQYGADYAKANRASLEAADPEKFAAYEGLARKVGSTGGLAEDPEVASLRRAIASQYAGDVAAGGNLTDDQRRFSEQQTRRSQQARGNMFGNAPAIEETLNALNLGESMRQTRLSNATNFLSSGQDYETASNKLAQGNIANLSSLGTGTPISSYFQANNAGQVGQGTTNATGSTAAGFNIGDSISGIGNLASSIYGTNANIYNTQESNNVNPFAAAAGLGINAVSAWRGK